RMSPALASARPRSRARHIPRRNHSWVLVRLERFSVLFPRQRARMVLALPNPPKLSVHKRRPPRRERLDWNDIPIPELLQAIRLPGHSPVKPFKNIRSRRAALFLNGNPDIGRELIHLPRQ